MLNILYEGIDNPLTISCPGYQSKDIVVEITGMHNFIRHVNDNQYVAVVAKDSMCLISISSKKGSKLLGTHSYSIRKIGHGEVRFGTLKSGTYPLRTILEQQKLQYVNESYLSMFDNAFVSRYRLITLPKKGNMSEVMVWQDSIISQVRKLLANLHNEDMILIEGISVNIGHFGERRFEPILLTVSDLVNDKTSRGLRCDGYFIENGKQKHYVYPHTEDQEIMQPYTCTKDSVWKYYTYHPEKKNYILYIKDSFKNGRRIYTEFYRTDSIEALDYKEVYINDTVLNVSSYLPNRKLYQTGNVLMNTENKTLHKWEYIEYRDMPVEHNNLEKYLARIPYNGPNGLWKFYDSLGNIQVEINYAMFHDTAYSPGCIDDPETPVIGRNVTVKYFRVVPDGECIIYKPDGRIERKIIFKYGKEIRK